MCTSGRGSSADRSKRAVLAALVFCWFPAYGDRGAQRSLFVVVAMSEDFPSQTLSQVVCCLCGEGCPFMLGLLSGYKRVGHRHFTQQKSKGALTSTPDSSTAICCSYLSPLARALVWAHS